MSNGARSLADKLNVSFSKFLAVFDKITLMLLLIYIPETVHIIKQRTPSWLSSRMTQSIARNN